MRQNNGNVFFSEKKKFLMEINFIKCSTLKFIIKTIHLFR